MSAANRARDEGDVVAKPRKLAKNFWARHRSEVVELNYQWVVENFSLKPHKKREKLSLPVFSADMENQHFPVHQFTNQDPDWGLRLFKYEDVNCSRLMNYTSTARSSTR